MSNTEPEDKRILLVLAFLIIVVGVAAIVVAYEQELKNLREQRSTAIDSAYAWKERAELYQQRIVKEKIDKLDLRREVFILRRKLNRLEGPVIVDVPPKVI